MLSKGIPIGLKKLILKKKINSKSIFIVKKPKKSNCNILNLNKNIAPTHRKNSTYFISSSKNLIDEDEKTIDMEIDSEKKKSSNNSFIIKGNDSFGNLDSSYLENYSTANSNTEIAKKNEIKPLTKKAEYIEEEKKSEINNSFETLKENKENLDKSKENEYIHDILENLKNEERNNAYKINPNYFKFQTDINPKMRTILIDWLFEVNKKLKFKEETFYITVNIIDSYLSQKFVPRKKFQLLGVTALFIATKLNEIFTGKAKDYAFITDNAYSECEIIDMEEDICKILNFNFLIPNCLSFFEIFSNMIGIDKDLKKLHFGKFLLQCYLMSSKSLIYNYSTISYSICYLIMKLFDNDNNRNISCLNLLCVNNPKVIEDCSKNIWKSINEILNSCLNLSIKSYYSENFDNDVIKYLALYTE